MVQSLITLQLQRVVGIRRTSSAVRSGSDAGNSQKPRRCGLAYSAAGSSHIAASLYPGKSGARLVSVYLSLIGTPLRRTAD